MKKFIAAAAILSLAATSAIAADTAALAPGKPAGTQEAQGILNNTPLLVLGGIGILVGVVLATQDSKSSVATGTAS